MSSIYSDLETLIYTVLVTYRLRTIENHRVYRLRIIGVVKKFHIN